VIVPNDNNKNNNSDSNNNNNNSDSNNNNLTQKKVYFTIQHNGQINYSIVIVSALPIYFLEARGARNL